jgi:hypothetical protein
MKTILILISLSINLYAKKNLEPRTKVTQTDSPHYQISNLDEMRKDLPHRFDDGVIWLKVWQKENVLCYEYLLKDAHFSESFLKDWEAVLRGIVIGGLEHNYKTSSPSDPQSVRNHFDNGINYRYVYHGPKFKWRVEIEVTKEMLLDDTH